MWRSTYVLLFFGRLDYGWILRYILAMCGIYTCAKGDPCLCHSLTSVLWQPMTDPHSCAVCCQHGRYNHNHMSDSSGSTETVARTCFTPTSLAVRIANCILVSGTGNTMPLSRIAVLIDGDNMKPAYFGRVFAWASGKGEVVIRRIYGNRKKFVRLEKMYRQPQD